jgi:hypothetical protein
MIFYQKPFISTMRHEPFISQSQYIPECEGQPCGRGVLGFVCDDELNAVIVTFFAPGDQNPPPCQVIVSDGATVSNCVFSPAPLASCNGGSVWQVTCDVEPNDPCDLGADVSISCDGTEVPCTAPISPQ